MRFRRSSSLVSFLFSSRQSAAAGRLRALGAVALALGAGVSACQNMGGTDGSGGLPGSGGVPTGSGGGAPTSGGAPNGSGGALTGTGGAAATGGATASGGGGGTASGGASDGSGGAGSGGAPSNCTPNGAARNPIVSHIFTADPSAKVFGDRVYVYTSHDADGQTEFEMIDYHAYSSDDLVNWQDHGVIIEAADLPWATNLYAPDACEKDGQYFLYMPNSGSGI